MKRIPLLTVLSVLGLSTFAQDGTRLTTPMENQIRFGIKAGVNWAKYKVEDAPVGQNNFNAESKTTANGGFLVNIPMGNVFRLQPEIIYNGQGAKLDFRPTGATQTVAFEQDLRYISVPIMIQAQTHGAFVEVGPQFSYLVSAKNDGDAPFNGDIKDQIDKFDFGVGGGIGYLSRIGLGVNVRYVQGLSDIIKDSNTNGGKLRNQTIQAGLFFLFGAYK